MSLYVRTLSCVALLGLALGAVSQYRPAWAVRMQLDWWSLPELQEEVRHGESRSARLDARCHELTARLTGKDAAIRDLRAGRLTLLQAAARFRDLNGADDTAAIDRWGRFAGATQEERLCRQVIQWAGAAGPAGEPTRRRLEAELADLLARNNGSIRLPP